MKKKTLAKKNHPSTEEKISKRKYKQYEEKINHK